MSDWASLIYRTYTPPEPIPPRPLTLEERIYADVCQLTGGYMYEGERYSEGVSNVPGSPLRQTVKEYVEARVQASLKGYSRPFMWVMWLLCRFLPVPEAEGLCGSIIVAHERKWQHETAIRNTLNRLKGG